MEFDCSHPVLVFSWAPLVLMAQRANSAPLHGSTATNSVVTDLGPELGWERQKHQARNSNAVVAESVSASTALLWS